MAAFRILIPRGAVIDPHSTTESDLARQTAAGSPDAMAALYRSHAGSLCRLAQRLTGSREDAEDIVHDLFVGLPEAIRSYEGRGNLQGWLKRVTIRLALMRLRSQRRRQEITLTADEPARTQQAAPDDSGQWDLDRAVDKLPYTLRVVLLLRQAEGHTHDEIAALVGITPAASRARFSRAVKHLKRILRGHT
jgi:RNA polymerase sigma-70 factor, ECF subfamily